MTEQAARAARRSFRAIFGKPGPMLSLRDESPAGENRGGTPAGERARKRRAAQAAFLRGASRTPLARGQDTMRFAGVPLPLFFRGRHFLLVIAGQLDPAIHSEGKPHRICR